ncbi:glycosyltransferase [uncultured Hymenobacter sp.]|uniref:glycosyltransferase n=1 Tax=uncultured Hymenobacter sp. TaxID=170016 RepID=UPI0035C9F64B
MPSRFHAAHEVTAAAPLTTATLLRRQLPAPRAGLQVSVVIPAKDEAESLPATLAAFATQVDLRGRPLTPGIFEVIVLANNCADDTAATVRRVARQFPRLALHVAELRLPPEEAHVGQARRLLMDEACYRLHLAGRQASGGLIASTDADTRVIPTWLAANLAEIEAGADAVGGRILTDAPRLGTCPVRRTQLRDATYHLLRARLERLLDPNPADPWPCHHQHFGASLAITVHAYQLVGGLPAVQCMEDEALWQALRRHDLRLRHSPAVQVLTSARQCGRVEVGLSWQLRQWAHLSEEQREPTVEWPAELAALWQTRQQLRAWWLGGAYPPDFDGIIELMAISPDALRQQLRQARTFGECWDRLMIYRTGQIGIIAPVPLSLALVELRTLIAEHERYAQLGQTAPMRVV